MKKAPGKKVAPKKRIRYRIGQVVWCPQLEGVVILGILDRKRYLTDLLVSDHFGDRYWIDSDDLRPWPNAKFMRPTPADRFRRLVSTRRSN
jgi:hypothetical protein